VVIGKVAVVAPPATVAYAGTLAEVLLLSTDTATPPAGAACVSVIVPTLGSPPRTVEGFTVRLVTPMLFTCVPTAYRFSSLEPTYTVPFAAMAGED